MRIFRFFLGVALGYAAVVVTVMFLTTLVSLILGPRFLDAGGTDAWSLAQVAVVLAIAAASAWCGGFAAAWWGGGRVCGYVLAALLLVVGGVALFAGRVSGAMSAAPLWIAAAAPIVGAMSAIMGTHSPRALHRRTANADHARVESP
ncbi:MAG: hypothetical protein FJ256_02495 [Phycisphaerae bacterium]|nr:hypothetical protein [Phycisphaerae bacterium]